MIQIIKFLLCTDILYIKWNFVRTFVVRVRRIFLDGAVYMGEAISALFVLSHTNGATGGGTGTGTDGYHMKDARAPRYQQHTYTPTVCCCELIAPLKRALRGHLNL